MKGELIVEALALFTGINNFKFKKMVKPGDRLELSVELTAMRSSLGKGSAKAVVDGKVAASGELWFAFVKQEDLD